MRPADQGDLDAVMDLLEQRQDWLRSMGIDQWNVGREFRHRTIESIARGETWVLSDSGEPIGTLGLTTRGDPDFWSEDELAERAVYLMKMASRVSRRGEGIGELMITWARDWAARNGFGVLRWDVWRTNKALQDYYKNVGASYVRTVEVSGRWSGVLFEMSAGDQSDLAKDIVTYERSLNNSAGRPS